MSLALLLLAVIPPDEPLDDRCDLIEINHVHDCHAGPDDFRSYVLFWRVAAQDGRYHVHDWRRLESLQIIRGGGWHVLVWRDGKRWRRVRARTFIESWTCRDLEVADRLYVEVFRQNLVAPLDWRRSLAGQHPEGLD